MQRMSPKRPLMNDLGGQIKLLFRRTLDQLNGRGKKFIRARVLNGGSRNAKLATLDQNLWRSLHERAGKGFCTRKRGQAHKQHAVCAVANDLLDEDFLEH
jgi:hypothetical protein